MESTHRYSHATSHVLVHCKSTSSSSQRCIRLTHEVDLVVKRQAAICDAYLIIILTITTTTTFRNYLFLIYVWSGPCARDVMRCLGDWLVMTVKDDHAVTQRPFVWKALYTYVVQSRAHHGYQTWCTFYHYSSGHRQTHTRYTHAAKPQPVATPTHCTR